MIKLNSLLKHFAGSVSLALLMAVAAEAQPYQSIEECYADLSRGSYLAVAVHAVCESEMLLNRLRETPVNAHQDGIDYIELGRNIRTIYERAYTETWAGGVRGFIGDRGDVFRITKQVADDGNIVYYLRINSQPRIYRYNASQDSAGYADVWSYSVGRGYLKCRVTMLTANGRYLATPQITHVETQDMYSAIAALLAF